MKRPWPRKYLISLSIFLPSSSCIDDHVYLPTYPTFVPYSEYVAKAKSPTDLQGIVEALGKKEYTVVADVVDPHMV